MDTMLVTGFEPFGAHETNASGQAALALNGQGLAGARLVGLQLPCQFDAAAAALRAALDAHRPDWVLALGLAPSRQGFSLERVAINLIDARIPDNLGAQPIDQPVCAGAAPALFATLPVKAMAAALQAAGRQAELSLSAGSYVCNHVFFTLMLALQERPGARGGFMHVGPELDAAAVAEGALLALAAARAQGPRDLATAGGSVD